MTEADMKTRFAVFESKIDEVLRISKSNAERIGKLEDRWMTGLIGLLAIVGAGLVAAIVFIATRLSTMQGG